jgi:ABC-type dipeptide/oligopeptide/nickel transport system ATPase subunit
MRTPFINISSIGGEKMDEGGNDISLLSFHEVTAFLKDGQQEKTLLNNVSFDIPVGAGIDVFGFSGLNETLYTSLTPSSEAIRLQHGSIFFDNNKLSNETGGSSKCLLFKKTAVISDSLPRISVSDNIMKVLIDTDMFKRNILKNYYDCLIYDEKTAFDQNVILRDSRIQSANNNHNFRSDQFKKQTTDIISSISKEVPYSQIGKMRKKEEIKQVELVLRRELSSLDADLKISINQAQDFYKQAEPRLKSNFKKAQKEASKKIKAEAKLLRHNYINDIRRLKKDKKSKLISIEEYYKKVANAKFIYFLTAKKNKTRSYIDVKKILEEVGINDVNQLAFEHFLNLNQEEKMRIRLASCLMGSPRLIIADFSSSRLDMAVLIKIRQLIRSVCKKRGISSIFICSYLELFKSISVNSYYQILDDRSIIFHGIGMQKTVGNIKKGNDDNYLAPVKENAKNIILHDKKSDAAVFPDISKTNIGKADSSYVAVLNNKSKNSLNKHLTTKKIIKSKADTGKSQASLYKKPKKFGNILPFIKRDPVTKSVPNCHPLKIYLVEKRKDGRWIVTIEGGIKAIKLFKIRSEAVTFADGLCTTNGGYLKIKSSKGKNKGRYQKSNIK